MSTTPQNVAIVMVFLVLTGIVALTVAPYELGTIRLAGVSLLWWYGAVTAPLLAAALTAAVVLRAARKDESMAAPAPESTASRG